MKHHLVESKILERDSQTGRERHNNTVLRAGAVEVHVHTGMNAVDATAWAAVKDTDLAVALLKSGAIIDRGLAPDAPVATPDPPPPAPDKG